ncbi:hypothetical protein QTH25_13115 [Clostridium perfringens]|nr:hypothetical protein [Clostridium perfringens]
MEVLREYMKNDIKKFLGITNKRYMYRDGEIDEKGINYNLFIKLRYELFNKGYIKYITVEGFRVLCYLICKSQNFKYITIVPKIIQRDLNLSGTKTIDILNLLFKNKILEGYVNEKAYSNKNKVSSINDILDCLITYTDDEIYPFKEDIQGYRPIPINFTLSAIKELTGEEWAMYCFLIVRHRYFMIVEKVDKNTGEINNIISTLDYAFPKQEDIANILNCDRRKTKKIGEKLEAKGYIKMDLNRDYKTKENGKGVKYKECYKYKIILLDRTEYIYHYIYKLENNDIEKEALALKPSKLTQYIKDLINNSPEKITNKLYLMDKIGKELIVEYREKNYNNASVSI